MSEPKKMTPTGLPDSPPFVDAGYVHRRGEIVTIAFMRAPFGPEPDVGPGDVYTGAPCVASVTMTVEGARAVLDLISGVLKDQKQR